MTSLKCVETFSSTTMYFGGEQNSEGYGPHTQGHIRAGWIVVTCRFHLLLSSGQPRLIC